MCCDFTYMCGFLKKKQLKETQMSIHNKNNGNNNVIEIENKQVLFSEKLEQMRNW